uniref:MIP08293p n=1 Tax=Drosophila melanogaster TaxID=7227 RepID=D8FT10_DROME|nr:MIP08293p [Drosophila melanogaster]
MSCTQMIDCQMERMANTHTQMNGKPRKANNCNVLYLGLFELLTNFCFRLCYLCFKLNSFVHYCVWFVFSL